MSDGPNWSTATVWASSDHWVPSTGWVDRGWVDPGWANLPGREFDGLEFDGREFDGLEIDGLEIDGLEIDGPGPEVDGPGREVDGPLISPVTGTPLPGRPAEFRAGTEPGSDGAPAAGPDTARSRPVLADEVGFGRRRIVRSAGRQLGSWGTARFGALGRWVRAAGTFGFGTVSGAGRLTEFAPPTGAVKPLMP